jgi:hypothetical protein
MDQKFKYLFNNEMFYGMMSGFGQSLIGHPADTYKTWQQTRHTEIVTIRSLYRGFTYPALTNGAITGMAFTAYEWCKKNDPKYGMLTGGISAGITTALLSGYFEYKKISNQLNNLRLKFPIMSIGTILMREIPACTAYYPVYDALRSKDINIPLAGGIAGMTCWISSYWADVLNTHVVCGNTLSDTIKKLKFRDYFRGLNVMLVRAFIVNATGYFFYEASKSTWT